MIVLPSGFADWKSPRPLFVLTLTSISDQQTSFTGASTRSASSKESSDWIISSSITLMSYTPFLFSSTSTPYDLCDSSSFDASSITGRTLLDYSLTRSCTLRLSESDEMCSDSSSSSSTSSSFISSSAGIGSYCAWSCGYICLCINVCATDWSWPP